MSLSALYLLNHNTKAIQIYMVELLGGEENLIRFGDLDLIFKVELSGGEKELLRV